MTASPASANPSSRRWQAGRWAAAVPRDVRHPGPERRHGGLRRKAESQFHGQVMGPRVLIVGGTRFIGAHAARQLVEAGAEVTVFHRGRSENPILPPVAHIRDAAAEYPITRFPAAVTQSDWDVVVHMVIMGEADARAAGAAFAGRAGRLVMISSGDVQRAYGRLTGHEPGPPDPVPLTEEAPLRSALYPYRAQAAKPGTYAQDYEKILAEQVLRA